MRNQKIIVIISALCLSIGMCLFGKPGIELIVYDSFTKMPLDSVTVYLRKDSRFLDSIYHECAWMEIPFDGYMAEMLCTYAFDDVPKGNYELLITAPGHVSRSIPVRITSAEQRENLGIVYIDNIDEPADGGDLIPKEKIVIKAYHQADSSKVSNNSSLLELLKLFEEVSVDDNGLISLNGELVEIIKINGKTTLSGNYTDTIKNIPASIVDWVRFYNREYLDRFADRRMDIKYPLTMDVKFKRQTYPEDNDGLWIILATITLILLVMVLGIVVYHRDKEKKDGEPEQDLKADTIDKRSFVEAFVRRNINGASEEELKKLEEFVRRMDPEYCRKVASFDLKERDFYDVMLIRLGVSPSDCGNVLGCSASTLGMKRLRMFRNLDDNRGFNRWEDYILSFSSKNK